MNAVEIKSNKKNLFERKLNFQNKVKFNKHKKKKSADKVSKSSPTSHFHPSGVTNIKSHIFHNIQR